MTQPPEIKFNLYWNIKVKLTAKGLDYWTDHPPIDHEGFAQIKLHEFIKIFGPDINSGRSPFFENILYLLPPPVYPEKEIIRVNL